MSKAFNFEEYDFSHNGCNYKFYRKPDDVYNHTFVLAVKGNKAIELDLGLLMKDTTKEYIGNGWVYTIKENDKVIKHFIELTKSGGLELL